MAWIFVAAALSLSADACDSFIAEKYSAAKFSSTSFRNRASRPAIAAKLVPYQQQAAWETTKLALTYAQYARTLCERTYSFADIPEELVGRRGGGDEA